MADQNNFKLTGEVKFISETEARGDKGYEVRFIVIETDQDTKYPQLAKIEFNGEENAEKLDKVFEGDIVEVSFNVRGRKWVNKADETQYFTSLAGWKVKQVKEATKYQAPVIIATAPGGDDDLPF